MGLGTMIRSLVTIVLLLFSTTSGRQSNWDSHSAYILPPKSWSVGIFQPLRYGLQEGLELSSHPGWFFVLPNASFKIPFLDFKSFHTAAKVSFTYPTPLLNMLSREGIGGIIDPNLIIPPMLGISGSFIMSKEVFGVNLSGKAGLDFGLVFGDFWTEKSHKLKIWPWQSFFLV